MLALLVLSLGRLFATDCAWWGVAWCGAARAAVKQSASQQVPLTRTDPLHDAVLAGEALIVVQGEGRERHLIRSTRREDRTLETMSLRGALGQEAIVMNGDRWWYGSTGEREGMVATTFVVDDGSGGATTSSVPVTGRGPYVFLPLRGEQPRGLQFAATNRETTKVSEVDATRAVRSWQVPRIDLLNAHVIAERLPDHRVALFAVRGADLELLVLEDKGQFETFSLRDAAPFQFATAIDAAGRIAIVTASSAPGGQSVEGTVLDLDDPAASTWYVLATNARLAAWPSAELKVVSTPSGFVAAWVDRAASRRFTLQACDLKTDGSPVVVADVGDPTEGRAFGAFFSVQAVDDDLLFFWDDGRNFVMRRIASSIRQFVMTQRLASFCDDSR